MSRTLSFAAILVGAMLTTSIATGQMVTTSTPFNSIGSNYFESNTMGWSLQGRNWFANFGDGGPLLPPLGGATGGGGLSGGVGFAGGGVRGTLGFNFAQGSSQSINSTTASVTTMDGYPGSISAGVVRPFVVGFTPVVGDYAVATAPLENAQQTSAQIGQQQMSSLRQAQTSLRDRKLAQYIRRAEQGESSGNKRMARANYRLAISIAPEPLRTELHRRMSKMLNAPQEPVEEGVQ